MLKRRFYSILLFLLTAILSLCSGAVFSHEPLFSADMARRLLDEAAEKADTAFSIPPEQVQIIRADGDSRTVELTLCWESAVPISDEKSVEFQLLRLAIDYGSFVFWDEGGNRWRPVAGGESNVVLLDRDFSKTFRIKLKPDAESAGSSSGDSRVDSTSRLSGSGQFSALIGLAITDFLFPDILAPVLESNVSATDAPESASAHYRARRTLDAAAVTVWNAQRLADGVRLTLGVEYAEPFDFFDSHAERLYSRPMSLHRAELTRGALRERPKSVRPLAMFDSGGTFEILFDLPVDSEARDFSIRLPVRLIEKQLLLPVRTH